MRNSKTKIYNMRTNLYILGLCCLLVPSAFAQRSSSYGSSSGGGSYRGGGGSSSGGTSGSSTGSGSTRDYPNNTMIGDATITVDPETRRVIVITDDETGENIKEVIKNLDKPKPQVLIKVVFLEVTHKDGLDVGFEGGVTKRINGSLTNTGSLLFGLAQQGITPSSPATSLPGAGMYSIVGSDFSATLRAIAEAGKIEVLSRPSILARNNQQASIVVGQQVPLITGTTYDTFGNQHNAFTYQNVGIILQVTPFITSDGLVEMIVAPQISSLDANQSVQISSSTNGTALTSPVIDIRSANTVVVTPNGTTVVIGGLMQNSKSTTDSKIPFFGDIPLLGNLFKHKVRSNSKTELIIFLTPYVVRTPMELASMSSAETGRAQLAPKSFTEKELNTFIEGVPMKGSDSQTDKKSKKGKSSSSDDQ